MADIHDLNFATLAFSGPDHGAAFKGRTFLFFVSSGFTFEHVREKEVATTYLEVSLNEVISE